VAGFEFFQCLAGGIVKNVVHGTGRKLELFADFNGLLAGYRPLRPPMPWLTTPPTKNYFTVFQFIMPVFFLFLKPLSGFFAIRCNQGQFVLDAYFFMRYLNPLVIVLFLE